MEMLISCAYAVICGIIISALYYALKIAFLALKSLLQSHRKASSKERGKLPGRAACDVLFIITCALIYSLHLYITLDGALRFTPLVSGVLSFAIFSKVIAKPIKKRFNQHSDAVNKTSSNFDAER